MSGLGEKRGLHLFMSNLVFFFLSVAFSSKNSIWYTVHPEIIIKHLMDYSKILHGQS